MAESTTTGFNTEETPIIGKLGSALTILAPILILAGVLRLALGVIDIATTSWGGLLTLPEGALLAFAGLAFLAASTDAKFLRDVKGREKEHLGNTLASLNVGFTALLILGCYVAFFAFINIWV